MLPILTSFALVLAAGDSARFHPADVDVYVEVPDLRATRSAYAQAPLVKMLHDPAAARVGDAARQMGVDLGKLLGALEPERDPDRPDDAWWPWSSLTSLSVSLAGLDAPAGSAGSWLDRTSAWIVLDFENDAAAEQALLAIGASAGVTTVATKDAGPAGEGAARDAPQSAETIDVDGHAAAIVHHEIDLLGTHASMWLAQSQARLVGGFGRARPADLAARLAKPESSFAAQHALLVQDDVFPSSSGVTIARAWSDLEQLPRPGAGAPTKGLASSLYDMTTAAIVPFVGQRGAYRLQLRGDRFVWESLTERIGPARALAGLYGTGGIPTSTARLVPKEAVGVWLVKFQPAQLEALLQGALAPMSAAPPPSPSEPAPAPLLAGVGDSAAAFLMPLNAGLVTGGAPVPNVMVALELKDASAFATSLESWITRARALDPKLQVENKPYHKLPMYTFSHASGAEGTGGAGLAAGIESALRPTLVIFADRIVVTTTRTNAQSEVRRVEGAHGELHALASEGAIPKDAFEVGWMDWGSLVGKMYDLGRGFLPMLAQGGKIHVDASTLPASAELFRFFQPSTSFSTRIGDKQYSYAASSLGPETPLAFVALVYAFEVQSGAKARRIASAAHVIPGGDTLAHGEIRAGKMMPPATEVQASAPHARTTSALRDVKTGLAVYRSQLGRVPDTLDELLKGTDAFPHGFLEGGAVPKDEWNHALVYAARDQGARYALWSMGPNGVDDHGGGDDVIAP